MRNAFSGAAIAASALLAASVPAAAQPFYVIQSGADAWTVVDPSTIETAGPVRKAWAIRIQRELVQGPPPEPGYVRTLTEYDCAQERTLWREFAAFSRDGKLLAHRDNPHPVWTPVSDDADAYAAWRVMCQGGGGNAIVSADNVAKVVIALMGSWDAPAGDGAKPTPAPAAKPAPRAHRRLPR